MSKPEGMNLGVVLAVLWLFVLLAIGWKQRGSTPLWEPNPERAFIVIGILVGLGTVYVWWANRRDSK